LIASQAKSRSSGVFCTGKLYSDPPDLPWNFCTEDNLDLNNARRVLDEDHFGLRR
jgi:ATP-dependent Lon protease